MNAFVLYENPDWMPPLRRELNRAGIAFEEWFLHKAEIDLDSVPPEGVFVNRISPSSHTRGHEDSISLGREVFSWLESHGRRVINGTSAFALEVSKVRQYAALRRVGLRTPRTIAVTGGPQAWKSAARRMPVPFITKHNCGGKGLGVQLFRTTRAFDEAAETGAIALPLDHILLLQEYIQSPEPYITRVEIVGGEFQYAILSDTSRGFELCPAERCEAGDASCPATDGPSGGGDAFLPASDDPSTSKDRQSLFALREGFDDPIIQRYIDFMRENHMDVAGFEFIEDGHGNKITYDINGTTNYSPGVEERHGLNGMESVARLIGDEVVRADRHGRPEIRSARPSLRRRGRRHAA